MNCHPCEKRHQRVSHATRLVGEEPWCEPCFTERPEDLSGHRKVLVQIEVLPAGTLTPNMKWAEYMRFCVQRLYDDPAGEVLKITFPDEELAARQHSHIHEVAHRFRVLRGDKEVRAGFKVRATRQGNVLHVERLAEKRPMVSASSPARKAVCQ